MVQMEINKRNDRNFKEEKSTFNCEKIDYFSFVSNNSLNKINQSKIK